MGSKTFILPLLAMVLPALTMRFDHQSIRSRVSENLNNEPVKIIRSSGTRNIVPRGENIYLNSESQLPLDWYAPHMKFLLKNNPRIMVQEEEIAKQSPQENVIETIKINENLPVNMMSQLSVIEPKIVLGEEELRDVFVPTIIQPKIDVKEKFVETIKVKDVLHPRPIEVINEIPVAEIFEEKLTLPPVPVPLPIPIYKESEPIIQEIVDMPEAPILPPINIDFQQPIVVEDVNVEEPVSFDKPVEILPIVREIPKKAVIESIVVPEFKSPVMEEILQPDLNPEEVILIKERFSPIPKAQIKLTTAFSPRSLIDQPVEYYRTIPIMSDDYLSNNFQEEVILQNDLKVLPEFDFISKPRTEKKTPCTRCIVDERTRTSSLFTKRRSPKRIRLIPRSQ